MSNSNNRLMDKSSFYYINEGGDVIHEDDSEHIFDGDEEYMKIEVPDIVFNHIHNNAVEQCVFKLKGLQI